MAALLLVGCSGAPGQDDVGEAPQAATEQTLLTDVDATNCEIFVDKVQPIYDSHGAREYSLFVKTLNGRLNGAIVEVGFFGSVRDCSSGTCGAASPATITQARPFVGASDYFELELQLGSDFSPTVQYEGAFFVRTDQGRTYWHKTKAHKSFFLDDRGLTDVRNGLSARGVTNFFSTADLASEPKTADYYEYLNPYRCR